MSGRKRSIEMRRSYVMQCSCGGYPWDDWQKKAITCGVSEDLAIRGREVMREAFQHDWPEKLKSLCGWSDDGGRMIELALRSPETAVKRWRRLMETDGNRGEYNEKTGQWEWFL